MRKTVYTTAFEDFLASGAGTNPFAEEFAAADAAAIGTQAATSPGAAAAASGGAPNTLAAMANLIVDGPVTASAGGGIVINAVLASTTGNDSEYIELFGPTRASLAGLSFIGIEANEAVNEGAIDFRYDFADGEIIGENGFFLLGNQEMSETLGVTPNRFITDLIENSSTTYALVETASIEGGSVTDALVVRDAVASHDPSESVTFFGEPILGPSGPFFPAGVRRVEDGVDNDIAADFNILDFFNDVVTNAPTAGEETPFVVINEVLASTTGTDSEYIELFGLPGTSLAGMSFVSVEGNDGSALGEIEFRFDFVDDAQIGGNGFLLLANAIAQATYGVTANETFTDPLENSSATYALVETASLEGGSVTGSEVVIDAVASHDTSDSTAFFDAPVVGPDGPFFPAGVGRIHDGVDSDMAADFEILSFSNDTDENTPTAGTGLDGGGGGGGGGGSIDDAPTLISAIQGSGDDSPLVGQTLVVEGIVTGDFQNGDADTFRDLGGFFIMEEAEDQDADVMTSEGIFAFEGDTPLADVQEGDKVRVLGTVNEFFGRTSINITEIVVVEEDAVDPMSLAAEIELPAADAREAYEGMLVTINEALTFSESFDYEDFGDATLTSDGPIYQYTQLNDPSVAGFAAHQQEVADRSITLTDGSGGSRSDFDPITEPDGDLIGGPETGVRMGQSTTDLTAIMDFSFGEYVLRLPEAETFELDEETNPVPDAPADVGSEYKIGSLNVLNYFTTIDGVTDNGSNPRGADDAEELARQEAKLVQAILGMDADVIGLIEIENDFAGEEFALKTLVEALNSEIGENIWALVDPGQEFVGDDAIAVAFIYDQTTTALVGGSAILDTGAFLDPLDAGRDLNRASLAQTFEEIETGGVFTASVNHLKSKGSASGLSEDDDAGDGAGRNNATREAAAEELAEWLASDPTGSGDDDVIILGDLNAYAMETPIQVLEAASYTDLARFFDGDVYSYRFSGEIGTLDYALANDALFGQVTGATSWNINSDTPVFFDYNTDDTFTGPNTLRPTDQGLFDGDSVLRSSDHDPIIVGLDLEGDGALLVAGDEGNNRLNGTDAEEIIRANGGRLDVVSGGAGPDTFVFTDLDDSRDQLRILDFDISEDVLVLEEASILSTRALGNNLLISLDEDRDSIFLSGVSALDGVNVVSDPLDLV